MSSVPYPDSIPVHLPVLKECGPERIILHVDMDSFYASVEMQRRPELRNRPVVVGADPRAGNGRGVACTCSYEARAFGIRSAMPVSQAMVLCPHAVFIPPDFDHYSRVSQEIMDLLRSLGYPVFPVSIDEAFLDISTCASFRAAEALAGQIQEMMFHRLGLTCSVGIGPGKTIAKIASDYRKPGGLTVVEPKNVREFLGPLPVRKIPGVGKKSEAELLELGIRTVGDLAASDIQNLLSRFGRVAVPLHELALGNDTSELGECNGVRSVSRETTFDADTNDIVGIMARLDGLVTAVYRSLADECLRCKTVTVKIRYQGFVTRTKSRTLSHYTGEAETIRNCSLALIREMYDGKMVRLIGIRLSSFEKQDRCQMTLRF
jgi:DNA polymerase IV (archaeal DinB-like DNA polymerase)